MFKELLIETGINAFLMMLKKQKDKGRERFSKFLFSENMQNTIGRVTKEYNEALEDWEEMNDIDL